MTFERKQLVQKGKQAMEEVRRGEHPLHRRHRQ